MKIKSEDEVVDESVDEIVATEERSEAETVEDTRDERLGDHRPFRQKLAGFFKSGVGKTIIGLLLIIGVALAVPMTRYALLGVFIKKQTTITVVDELSGNAVSEAVVHFGRQDAKTDSKGTARLENVSVGDHALSVEKKYYTTASVSYVVSIYGEANTTVKLKATGRVATITAINAISGKPLAGATVKIGDTTATTDDAGAASIALATKDSDQAGEISLKDFTTAEISVNTKDIAPSIEAKLVPAGEVYFLSNRTGGYDVMSSTLDGKDQKVVVQGTGKEVAFELQLQASADRSYLAYMTRRGNETSPDIYVINTATGALDKVNESTGGSLVGWIGSKLYFGKYNYNNGVMVDKRAQLMAYAADSKQLTALESSRLEGDQWNYAEFGLSNFQLVGDRIYYAKCWSFSNSYDGSQDRKASFMAIVDGNPTSLKDVSQNGQAYCDTVATKPGIVYYRLNFWNESRSDSYRYQLGKAVESVQVTDGELYNNRYTYLSSPSGQKTFWTETRDGKKVSFIGDATGQNAKQVGSADYTAYGWFGDDYVLYSTGGSELYAAATGAQLDGAHKVADYFSQPQGPGY